MKLFEVLLSGYDQTIALVVGAETLERAEELAREEYEIKEEGDEWMELPLSIYRSSEIRGGASTGEFVREVFNTNEL